MSEKPEFERVRTIDPMGSYRCSRGIALSKFRNGAEFLDKPDVIMPLVPRLCFLILALSFSVIQSLRVFFSFPFSFCCNYILVFHDIGLAHNSRHNFVELFSRNFVENFFPFVANIWIFPVALRLISFKMDSTNVWNPDFQVGNDILISYSLYTLARHVYLTYNNVIQNSIFEYQAPNLIPSKQGQV